MGTDSDTYIQTQKTVRKTSRSVLGIEWFWNIRGYYLVYGKSRKFIKNIWYSPNTLGSITDPESMLI